MPTDALESARYSKLDGLEHVDPDPIEDQDFELGHGALEHRDHQLPHTGGRRRFFWMLLVAAFVVTNVVSCFIGAASYHHAMDLDLDLDAACAAHTTQYSPLLKEVQVKYDWVDFNGSFIREDVFRLDPGPEVDEAWESLGVDYPAGVISAEDGPRSGLTEAHVQVSDKYGGGFFVNVEGMHHLHCLNLVRKALYYNYDYYKGLGTHAFLNDDFIVRKHVSHCLDTVRQVLMCNVDTGVLGQVWFDAGEGKPPTAFPDFQTRHKCKNFDDVREWAGKLQAPLPGSLPDDYLKVPKPEHVLPATP